MVVGGGDEVLRIRARMVTVTNPINPGDSGGPLIDRRGYQVGVCESGRNGVQNVNNCVDITEVRGFLNEKKITIKELSDEKDETKKNPKGGMDSVKPKNGNGATPPKVDAPPKVDGSPKVDTPPEGAPSAEDEKAAEQLLARARLFATDEDNRPTYIAKLKDVVTKYPKTKAAKEAQKKLDTLK